MPLRTSPRSHSRQRLVALMTLTGFATGLAAADSTERTIAVRLDPQCELIADVQTDESAACWHLQCAGKAARKLGCDLTALHQIVDFTVAGDRNSLAVLTVGEGHPILEIVPLAPFLNKGEYTPQCSINPYPGSVSGGEWQNDHWRVESDVNLLVEDIEERANSIADHSYRFDVLGSGCTLTPVSDH